LHSTWIIIIAMRTLLVVALVGCSEAFLLGQPRLLHLRSGAVAMMSDEPLLQDAAKSVFDADECVVDAENAAELQECAEPPDEPFVYAGAPPAEKKLAAPPIAVDEEECIVDAENADEIADCKSDISSAAAAEAIEEGGCEIIGETADEVWFACDEKSDSPAVECDDDAAFGTGGGPGILPQDGEVLCKAAKPK